VLVDVKKNLVLHVSVLGPMHPTCGFFKRKKGAKRVDEANEASNG